MGSPKTFRQGSARFFIAPGASVPPPLGDYDGSMEEELAA